jgi:peptide/nickel transport system substrate-binding protein
LSYKTKSGLAAVAAAALVASMAGPTADADAASKTNTLVIVAPSVPVTLDAEFGSSATDWSVLQNCCDALTQFQVKTDPNGQLEQNLSKAPIGLLATSYHRTANGKGIVFNLRRGVQSSYGDELTSADILWSFQRGIALKGGSLFLDNVASINLRNPISILGKYEFRVNLTAPNPLAPLMWAVPFGNGDEILDATEAKKHATAQDPWAKAWLATHTDGFGPYNVSKFVTGQEVVWQANPYYYQHPPAFETVIYEAVPNTSSEVELLKTGAADVALYLDDRDVLSVAHYRDIHLEAYPGDLAEIFGMNNREAPLNNRLVRQAIAYALPVNEIKSSVYPGDPMAAVAPGYWPASYPGSLSSWPYAESVQKAKALLHNAGVKLPLTISLDYSTTDSSEAEIATIIRTGLARVGIDVVINGLSPAAFQEVYYKHTEDTLLDNDASFLPDGPYTASLYFLGGKSPGVANWVNYNNPEVNSILEQATASGSAATRAALTKKAAKLIVGDAPWGFYLQTGFYFAARSQIHGFVWRTSNWLSFYDLK